MSDSDTTDSDSGIRFKTTSTRFRLEDTDKYPATSKPSHSAESNNGHRRNRRSERDHRHSSDDHRTNRRSKRSSSRSKSRSRSRERRKQKEKDRRKRRSRSRSRSESKKAQIKREHDSSSSRSSQTKTTTMEINDTSSVAKQSKILDISVSSLSSQEDHIGKDEISEDMFGPALPPSLQGQVSESTNNNSPHEDEKTDAIGPALPPHLVSRQQDDLATNNTHIIGPTLPADIKLSEVTNDDSESELSPFSEEEPNEEDDFIGPVLGASSSRSHVELEQRALELKIKRFDSENYNAKNTHVSSREDWMLELPDIRKVSDMGLGARQFRTREKQPIGDRSVWTDTPSERARKTSGHSSKDPKYDHEIEQERRRAAERDKQQDELVKRYKKKHKRDKSMLEIHQTKLKKEKKSSSSESTRRPFDRNIDLHANQLGDAQKKAIYKKAQLLDTRFSSGASKFL